MAAESIGVFDHICHNFERESIECAANSDILIGVDLPYLTKTINFIYLFCRNRKCLSQNLERNTVVISTAVYFSNHNM